MLDTNFWKKYFKEYDVLNKLIPYNDLLLRIVNLLPKNCNKILDLGSGTGNLSEIMLSRGFNVTSLDYSKEGIDIHKSKNINANVIIHDLNYNLPFDDKCFDAVVSNNVLYTFNKDKQVKIAKEIYRVLKSDGIVVLSNLIENFNPFSIYKDHINLFYKKNGLIKTLYHLISLITPTIKVFYYNYLISKENGVGNYHFFKPEEQYNLLKETGFVEISDDEVLYSGQLILNFAKK